MRPRYLSLVPLLFVVMFGAGCNSSTVSISEPFRDFPSQQVAAEKNGFGSLPAFSYPTNSVQVEFDMPVPTPADAVSVLRMRGGLPNETEWRNITGAIGLPGTLLGDLPTPKSLTASWADSGGTLWNYDAATNRLEFASPVVQTSLTLTQLPATEDIIRIATTFFQTRALPFRDMRDPSVAPDWNAWLKREQDAGRCVNSQAVQTIREIAKQPLTFPGFPSLPERAVGVCSIPEFPTIQHVVSAGAKDGLDVVQADGSPLIVTDLLVDISKSRVISGSIRMLGDVERSDYPAINRQTLEQRFHAGGLSRVSGRIRLNQYQLAYTQVGDLLIPVMIGRGVRSLEEQDEPIQLVVPLVP